MKSATPAAKKPRAKKAPKIETPAAPVEVQAVAQEAVIPTEFEIRILISDFESVGGKSFLSVYGVSTTGESVLMNPTGKFVTIPAGTPAYPTTDCNSEQLVELSRKLTEAISDICREFNADNGTHGMVDVEQGIPNLTMPAEETPATASDPTPAPAEEGETD